MAVYASFDAPAKLVILVQIGGGHIYGDNFEYFQALTLGANNTFAVTAKIDLRAGLRYMAPLN